MPIQLEENILRNLFCQAAVTGHTGRQRKYHRLVLVHKLFKIRLPVVGHKFRCYSLIRKNPRLGMQRVRDGAKKVRSPGAGKGREVNWVVQRADLSRSRIGSAL